jgi:ABC-type iron transport system FetAB permease component
MKFGGRKFIGFLIILIAGGIARHFSKTGLSYEDVALLIGAYGAFAFGNVAATIAALRGGATQQQPAQPDPQTQALLGQIMNGVALQNDAIAALMARQAPPVDEGKAAAARQNRAAIASYLDDSAE